MAGHRYKIILIGNLGVGKTALITRFVDDKFAPGKQPEIDFKEKTVGVDNKDVKLVIYDTAGQERFRALTGSYYRDGSVVVLLYDVTSQESFDVLPDLINDVRRYLPKASLILAGNKTDLESKRVITLEKGQERAKEYKIDHFEVSANDGGEPVQRLLESVARHALQFHAVDDDEAQNRQPMIIYPTNSNKDKKKGCALI